MFCSNESQLSTYKNFNPLESEMSSQLTLNLFSIFFQKTTDCRNAIKSIFGDINMVLSIKKLLQRFKLN